MESKQTKTEPGDFGQTRSDLSTNPQPGVFRTWQDSFIKKLLLIGVIFGAVAVVPSVYLSFYERRWFIGTFDIVVFVLMFILYFKDSLGYRFRAVFIGVVTFIIGVLLMVVLGPFGGGPVWLFAFPVIVGVLLGRRLAYLALGINLLVLVLVGVFLHVGLFQWELVAENPLEKWIVIVVNFTLLNILTTVSVLSILSALERAVDQERDLTRTVREKANQVENTNRKLRDQIEMRHESERSLAQSEQSYRLLADNTLDIIWTMDLEGRFTYVNPVCEQIFNYSLKDILGSRLEDYCTTDTLEKIPSIIVETPNNSPENSFLKGEIDLLDRNGTPIPLEVIGKLIRDNQGEPIGFQGTARDIRERRAAQEERDRLQSQLQQAQKMESIGRLAGGVAHDFNNLLTSITGNVSLAQMDLPPGDPMDEALDEIYKAAQSAASLTRQLLAFSRRQIIDPKVLDLKSVIDDTHKMLRRLIGEDIELIIKTQDEQGNIKVDPGQLEQILINLSVNARDAMPNGGRLWIETGSTVFDDDCCPSQADLTPGRYILLSVSDNGDGMDEETRRRIFDPFFTTKKEGHGTGLGLATVYGIVKQHRGYIDVVSEIGKGTTFKVYFPEITEEADALSKGMAEENLPQGRETVLLVEDESMVRTIAIKILKRQGYTVHSAESGPNALDLVNNNNLEIDLLLTDVVMPVMNGRELAEELHATLPDLKVLFVSGYTDDIIAHHGVLDDGLEFIGKPYTPQDLAKMVRKVLDKPV